MGYNEGGDPEAVKSKEGEYRSHGKTGVGVVEFRLLLNIELHVGIRQRLLIRTGNFRRVQEGGGRGEEEGRKSGSI